MTQSIRYLLAASLLLAAVVPASPVLAGVAEESVATPDAYESDDTSGTALAIAPAPYGGAPVEQWRTIDTADATTGDQDWFSFTVSDAQADAGYVVLAEVSCVTAGMMPVIEVYDASAAPADPASLPPGATDPAAIAVSEGLDWSERPGEGLAFYPDSSAPGDSAVYRARVRPLHVGAAGYGDAAGAYRLQVKWGLATRLAGADRAATAASISRERFAANGVASDAVVIASGWSFADGLAGATLAGELDCPMLLSARTAIPPATLAEITRLGVHTAYLLGGDGVLGDPVRAALAARGITVVRVWGPDRYATAAAIARKADQVGSGGTASIAFVASGKSFPDALSASAPAASAGAPVLLTAPDKLTTATAQAIADPALGITDVVIVGGIGAVSPAVEASIRSLVGTDSVRRLAGANRYATSREIAVWATNGGTGAGSVGTTASPDALPALAFSRVGIASGADYPDALAGGVFCGLAGSPLLLTEPGRVSPYIEARLDPTDLVDPGEDYYGVGTEGLGRCYAFGGTGAISASAFSAFDQLTGARF